MDNAKKCLFEIFVKPSGRNPFFKNPQTNNMEILIYSLVAIAVSGVGTYFVTTKATAKKRDAILAKAAADAEMLSKEKALSAKERFIQLKAEHEKAVNERNSKITQIEAKVKSEQIQTQKEAEILERSKKEFESTRKKVEEQLETLSSKREDVEKLRQEQIKKLEQIASLSADEAKAQIVEQMKVQAQSEAMVMVNDIIEEAKLTASKDAKKIVIQTIQRVATEAAVENSVTVFNIDSDEVKGRIIGREGRNIRALEAATGVEIIVDDTPEAIILSGFDPIRREIARLSLHQLVTDGRIHPARIEEVVNKVTSQIEEEIVEVGKRTAIDLGVHGLSAELIRLVGKMKYRSSYGQNLLQHSREVANLAGTMAAELGLNAALARRAGLLHDIGKVPDDEPELPHAIIGMKIAERNKEKAEVVNAIGAHHDEVEMTSLLSPIVQVCDAISGARPGARREVVENYIKRLKEMEDLAMAHQGVLKTFAIQAGRELRVIVGSEKVSDAEAEYLSAQIARKIQDEMTYPGQVKVTVIRETRSVAYAK